MTLHDRIMALAPQTSLLQKSEVLEIAKEADEFLDECEAALSNAVELHGSMRALKTLNKMRLFKDKPNEQ